MKKENLKMHLNEVKRMEEKKDREYISQSEVKSLKELFARNLKSYKEKNPSITDREWLETLFRTEFPEDSDEKIKQDAFEIVESIKTYDECLESVNESALKGISKERWLANKMQEAAVGVSVNQFGESLQELDDILYKKNMQMAEALRRNADGHIKMSYNLDGNIAEHMIASSTETSGMIQGENIEVTVRDVFTSDSVDVRAKNLDTGKYQNYQLKFGKDAKATIDLIERGNYDNQRLIVPQEQLAEVQAHFLEKGSNKTISDHIEAWGAEGKAFTKEEMKSLQNAAQQDGLMPSMDYTHYQTKDLALNIGKNTSTMALQSMAITTGFNVVSQALSGENIEADELVQIAIKTGADTSLKTITAGTLQVAIRKGIIKFISSTTPAGVIANIACVGIENLKILKKIATGELSLSKGIDHMGRTTISMVGGLIGAAKGATTGAAMAAWIPVVGPGLAVLTGVIGGMIGYFGGSKVGEVVYTTAKKVADTARKISKGAVETLKRGAERVSEDFKNISRKLGNLIFG